MVRLQQTVTNESIGPEIGDVYLQVILTILNVVGDVDLPGRSPNHAKIVAVERDPCNIPDFTEVEPQTGSGWLVPGQVKCDPVRGYAREVPY